MTKLSIIIPVYNEAATICQILDEVKAVPLPGDLEREIIVIDDGSTDRTTEFLVRYINDPEIHVTYKKPNEGKTAAVKFGLRKCTGDIILIQDADLEYHPRFYPQLLEPILSKKASVVYGSRFKGTIEDMLPVNRFANTVSRWTMNALFGGSVSDFHTGFKVFTRKAFEGIEIKSQRFTFDTEITAKFLEKGYKIHEIPIEYQARTFEEGKKITWGTALESYFFLLAYKFIPRRRPHLRATEKR